MNIRMPGNISTHLEKGAESNWKSFQALATVDLHDTEDGSLRQEMLDVF
jgi:hypothetical protein